MSYASSSQLVLIACTGLFVFINVHTEFTNQGTQISCSPSAFWSSVVIGCSFCFLIIWKFCENRNTSHLPLLPAISVDPHLQRHLYRSLSFSLSTFWSPQISSTLPVFIPPGSESLERFRRRLQCSRLRRSNHTPESKYSEQRTAAHRFCPTTFFPHSDHTKHPGLASLPFLPSAFCFHTRPKLNPLSLLGIHRKKPPFPSEPQRTVSTALLTTTPHELLSHELYPQKYFELLSPWSLVLGRDGRDMSLPIIASLKGVID